jgi:hypothetical protein
VSAYLIFATVLASTGDGLTASTRYRLTPQYRVDYCTSPKAKQSNKQIKRLPMTTTFQQGAARYPARAVSVPLYATARDLMIWA